MAFLSEGQLKLIGFKYIGKSVKISDRASIYNASAISIGDHTRIDDYCILSAGASGITLGRYIHIACYVSLIGQGSIIMEDFSGVSSRVSIYSSTDDFSGVAMTNPTVPMDYTNVISGNVILRKHVIVGSGAVILPNVELGEGAVLGALSLLVKNCDPFCIYVGIPARKVSERKRDLLEFEKAFKLKHEIDD